MKETREVRKRLGVEPSASASLVGYARRLLGELKRDMAFAGLMQGVRRRQVDGVLVEAISIFGQDEIRIHPPAPIPVPLSKRREKTDTTPRWIFAVPVVYSDTYLGPASTGDVYMGDAEALTEPQLIATRTQLGIPGSVNDGLISQITGAFDWKRRNVAVAWHVGYPYYQSGYAYFDHNGTVNDAKVIATGSDTVQGVATYDRHVYVLHGYSHLYINVDGVDTNIDSIVGWATSLFVSSDGKYLLVCTTQNDVSPPYMTYVLNSADLSLVGSYAEPQGAGGWDTLFYNYDQQDDSLYIGHNYGNSPGSTTELVRVDLDLQTGALQQNYRVAVKNGDVYGIGAGGGKTVYLSTYEAYTSEPGVVQGIDPKTGAGTSMFEEPEQVGANWPLSLVSDNHGGTFMYDTPSGDDDFRLTFMKDGAYKHIYSQRLVPFAYGEGERVEVEATIQG